MRTISICLLFVLVYSATSRKVPNVKRSFTIGYDRNCFLKDGQCFRYVSGEMHYFRVPRPYWKERMLKMRAAGLNALQTYIEWRSHEPLPGQYNFTGNLDIVQYVKTAAEVGLLVILRPGPYIAAERDMGGLPSWLLKIKKNMVLRTNDATYMFYVERYFSKLLPLLKPLTYAQGGPVISFQVENEYGSYFACDRDYTKRLVYVMKQGLGPDVLLFTTDVAGDSYLICGPVEGAYTTVDFRPGVNVTAAFAQQRKREPRGPLVNSEYYSGRHDHWGQPHNIEDGTKVAKTLDQILAINASVSIYMMHGGTSFGYSAGSYVVGSQVMFCPTSYDFDAPISEAGDITDEFKKIREVIKKYLPLPPGPIPSNSTKIAFGPVHLERKYPVIPLVDQTKPTRNKFPLTFEELGADYGFVYYESKVDFLTRSPALLSIPGIRDRGYVYVNRVYQGMLSRGEGIFSRRILIQRGQNLSIFVENQGRICFGTQNNDTKGILGNVTVDGKVIQNWNMWPMVFLGDHRSPTAIPIENQRATSKDKNTFPAVYEAEFTLPKGTAPSDTFLRLDGWYKGMVGINGFNLGRYWPLKGPQVTLYVPGYLLRGSPNKNIITVMELENAPCPGTGCKVTFVKKPVIDGPVTASPTVKTIKYKTNV